MRIISQNARNGHCARAHERLEWGQKQENEAAAMRQEKDTGKLEHALEQAPSIEADFEQNAGELREETLAAHLARLLAEKHLEKADVIARSGLGDYAYHIFAGRKRNPGKPKCLALALAMQLTRKEAQHLLYAAGAAPLYVRNPWDSVLCYALDHHMTVIDTNLLLESLSQKPLLE